MALNLRWRRCFLLGLVVLLHRVVLLGGVKLRETTYLPKVLSVNSRVLRNLRSGDNNNDDTSHAINTSTHQDKAFLHPPPFTSLHTHRKTPLVLEAVRLEPSSGIVGIGKNTSITVVTNSATLVAVDNACTVNHALVASSWAAKKSVGAKNTSEHFNYTLLYTVKEGDPSQAAGSVPISCVLKDQKDGEILRVFQFDDHNTVAVDAQKPQVLHVGLLRVPAKQFIGIGDTISLEVEASPDDVDLRISDCRINFPSVDSTPSTIASSGANLSNFLNLGRGLYSMDYVVHKNDLNRNFMNSAGGNLPFACRFWDSANNSLQFGPMGIPIRNMILDAHPPALVSASIYHSSSAPARIGTNITIAVVANEASLLAGPHCIVDNADIAASFDSKRNLKLDPSKMTSFFSFTVEAGQGDWAAGELSLDCSLQDAAGNIGHIHHFTDGNRLAGNTHSPTLADYLPGLSLALRFLLVCLASSQVARVFPSIGLPIVTGYLSVGIIVGPFVLALIPEASIRSLRFVDEISFAFISFSAGAALRVDDIYRHRRSIAYITTTIAVIEYVFGSTTIFVLSAHIPFAATMPAEQVIAVALLAGALVVARSPATVIAIVKEVTSGVNKHQHVVVHRRRVHVHDPNTKTTRASQEASPFSKIIVGVTVLMDLVVIVLYALTSLVCSGILANSGRGSHNSNVLQGLRIIGVFVAQMILSVCGGVGLAIIMPFLLWTPKCIKSSTLDPRVRFFLLDIVQPAVFLCSGFVIFPLSHWVDPYLEPLIVCLVAGFIITNRADPSVSRMFSWGTSTATWPEKKTLQSKTSISLAASQRFLSLEESLAEFIHVIFFTLTGAALSVNALLQNALIGAVIVSTRIIGLMIGAYVGGTLAQQPPLENKLSWMAYITQAGVALGLAKKVHLEYKEWGGDFATMIVAVVVINQVCFHACIVWLLIEQLW
eukprot:INCI4041.1.p1 GENE.INCI4041.1~~INCI4041.1.p1  ORF type:complete len:942 (-),score=157.56 INCI4041.1:430-3255(-)